MYQIMKLCIKCGRNEKNHLVLDHDYEYRPDNCQTCLGTQGGMLGNENIINGVIVCDYCTVDYMDGRLDISKLEGFYGAVSFFMSDNLRD